MPFFVQRHIGFLFWLSSQIDRIPWSQRVGLFSSKGYIDEGVRMRIRDKS